MDISNTKSSSRWLSDVRDCVNAIDSKQFTLADIYKFEARLTELHPQNRTIKAKIRQQLQKLRDQGYIEFTAKGSYRKVEAA